MKTKTGGIIATLATLLFLVLISACAQPTAGGTDLPEMNPSQPAESEAMALPTEGDATIEPAGVEVDLSAWNQSSTAVFSSDKSLLAVFTPQGITVYDSATLQQKALIELNRVPLAIAFSSDNESITGAYYDDQNNYGFQIFDLATGVELSNMVVVSRGEEYMYRMDYLATLSSDGTVLALVDYSISPAIRLWNTTNGQEINSLSINNAYCVEFSPDNSLLAVCDQSDNGVTIWDVASGNKKQTFEVLKDHRGVYSLRAAFSSDGRLLAVAAGYDEVLFDKYTVTLFDFASQEELFSLDVSIPPSMAGNPLFTMEFSDDGSLLATGSATEIKIWDISKKQAVQSIEYAVENNSFAQYDLLFSADGTKLISASEWNDQVIIWDVSTGEQIAP